MVKYYACICACKYFKNTHIYLYRGRYVQIFTHLHNYKSLHTEPHTFALLITSKSTHERQILAKYPNTLGMHLCTQANY